MLAIISDIHLGDGTCARSISPGAFYLFLDHIREAAYNASWRKDNRYQPIESLELILMGDILDPQHTTRWLSGRPGDPGYTRPWTDPSDPAYAATLQETTRAILANNAEGIGILRQMAQGGLVQIPPASNGKPDLAAQEKISLPVKIYYMVGNHDWHYHLPGPAFDEIRQEIIDAFGLCNPPKPFPWEAQELEPLAQIFNRYNVYGHHGDKYDKFNHNPVRGRDSAALGDVLAMEVLNRYPLEVAAEFGTDLPPALVDSLRKITNVRPALATPLWIAGQIHQSAGWEAGERRLKEIWDNLVDEFLENEFVRAEDKAFQFDMVDALQILMHISKRASFETINDIVVWVRQKMWGGGELSYTRHALQEPAFVNGTARYIVYGHTHHHEVIPLDVENQPPYTGYNIYLNSGTWHSYYTLAARDPSAQKFVPSQMMTYLLFYQGDERAGRNLEAWSGLYV